jgi:predicted Zn-dependent peptidase
MIVLVIGDFETPAMRDLLEDTFGQHPAQPIPPRPEIQVPPIESRIVKRTEADIGETHIDLHYRLPAYTHPSYYAMTLLTEILNERAMSPLQARLTGGETPLATRVSASLETQEEFSALRISATTDDPEMANAVIEEVENIMRDLPQLDVPTADVEGIITRLKVEDIFLREKLHYYAIMRAPMLVVTGYDFMNELPARLGQVRLADIRQAAAEFLTGDKYVATVVTPKAATEEETALAQTAPRSDYVRRTLDNGLTVIVKSNPDSRVFAINVLGKNRSACEPEGLIGISDFVNRMLTRGTAMRSADDISRALNAIGAELTTNDNPYIPYDDRYTTPQYTFVKFATIDEYADSGAALLAEMIGQSAFPAEEVAKVQREVMGILGMSAGSNREACRGLFHASLFGNGPFARPIMGSHETVMQFTSDDLRQHLHTLYAPANTILTCVTNLSTGSAIALLERTFGQIPQGTPPRVTLPNPITPQGPIVNHAPMEKEQVYIYLGGPLPGASDADVPAIQVATDILSTRLADELREKQGLAYSVGASVKFDREFGWHLCVMGTGKDNYPQAKDGILAEIQRLREELPADTEVEIAQNSIWGSTLTRQLSRVNQAYYMGIYEYLGLGYDYAETIAERIRAVRPADVQRVARTYFDTENYVLATAGTID